MKLSEIVVHMGNYNLTKFNQNQMKNKKVFLITRFLKPDSKNSKIVPIVVMIGLTLGI